VEAGGIGLAATARLAAAGVAANDTTWGDETDPGELVDEGAVTAFGGCERWSVPSQRPSVSGDRRSLERKPAPQ
jgi:hypothetical protein